MSMQPDEGPGKTSVDRTGRIGMAWGRIISWMMYRTHWFFSGLRRKLTDRAVKPFLLPAEMLATPPLANKTIWMYWSEGWDKAPPIARLSHARWRAKNPGWTVRFVDREQALALTRIPAEIAARDMMPAHFADMVRLELLLQHGGVWADVTSFCEIPLDEWLVPAMPHGFFAFAVTEQKTAENWFIAAARGHPIVRAWLQHAYDFWASNAKPTNYLLFYDLFNIATTRDADARRAWRFSTKIERMQQHVMRRTYLERQQTEPMKAMIARRQIQMHKFSFKCPIPDDFAGTPLAHVLGYDTRAEMEAAAALVAIEPVEES